jgi:hypothetical protein
MIQLYRNRQNLSFMAFVRHCFPFRLPVGENRSHGYQNIHHPEGYGFPLFDPVDGLHGCRIKVWRQLIKVVSSRSCQNPSDISDHNGLLRRRISRPRIFRLSDTLSGTSNSFFAGIAKSIIPRYLLNPLTTKRGHSLPIAYGGIAGGVLSGIPAGIFAFLFGLTLTDVLFLGAVGSRIGTLATLDPLKHSHFPVNFGWLDRILISPHMHQVHHSSLTPHLDKKLRH